MQITARPITLLDFAKIAIYGFYLNYYGYYLVRGSYLPYGTQVFFFVAIACVIVSAIGEKIEVGSEVKCWIAYAVFSLVTVAFAVDPQYALDGIGKYVQRLAVILVIAYICEREKSIGFAIRVLAITAIICSVCCLVKSVDISRKLVLESGAHISTNDIGALMAFGCFAVLFAFGNNKKKSILAIVLKIVYIIAAISVIFIAGSRKSILAVLILFALFFLLCARDYFQNMSAVWLIISVILIVAAIVFVYYYLLPNVESTDMYQSVYGRKVEHKAESDAMRIEFYRMAFSDFLNHPLFGLGFNNFFFVHKNYSHSTFMDPLACSGLGGLLYVIPYIMILIKQIKLIVLNKTDKTERLWQNELLAFYIVFLFVGFGIPYLYKDIPCIILAIFIASQKISYDKLNQEESIIKQTQVQSAYS